MASVYSKNQASRLVKFIFLFVLIFFLIFAWRLEIEKSIREENIKHFSNSINLHNKASKIINEWGPGLSVIDYSQVDRVVEYKKRSLGEALKVDVDLLNKKNIEFGSLLRL